MPLALTQSFSLIPYPIRSNSLRRHNHITIFKNGKRYNLSQLPNFEFVIGGSDYKARVLCFLPNLVRKHERTNRYVQFVSNERLQVWWEKIVYPSYVEAVNNDAIMLMKIPSTFEEAERRSRQDGTGLLFTKGYEVPTAIFPNLVENMRSYTQKVAKYGDHSFVGFFFHTFMKGLKIGIFIILEISLSNMFPGTNNEFLASPLENFLDYKCPLQLEAINFNNLYLDIGCSIWQQSVSLTPMTVLWDGYRIKSLWQNASKRQPEVDSWCYMDEVFGIRGEPAEGIKQETGCIYTQVYHLEKESTYTFNGGTIVDNISPGSLLGNPAKLKLLEQAWKFSSTKNWGSRLEWRVEIRAALKILSQSPNLLLQHLLAAGTMFAIPTTEVVRWKCCRLEGFQLAISEITLKSNQQLQTQESKLVFLAFYLIKALVARPIDDTIYRKLKAMLGLEDGRRALGYAVVKYGLIDFTNLKLISELDDLVSADTLMKATKKKGSIFKHSAKSELPITMQSLVAKQVNIPEVDFTRFGIAPAANEVTLHANKILKSFYLSLWERFPESGKRDLLISYPSFTVESVSNYCTGVKFLQPACNSSTALTWDKRFEAFFVNNERLKGSDTKYAMVNKFEYVNMLNQLRIKNASFFASVLDLIQREFNSWEVIPASSAGKLFPSVKDNGKTLYKFARNEKNNQLRSRHT